MTTLLSRTCGVSDEGLLSQDVERRKMVKSELYERLPAQRIAALSQTSTILSRNEVEAALRHIVLAKYGTALDTQSRNKLVDQVASEVLGLGPIDALLADPSVTEVMVNGPSRIFYEKAGRLHLSRETFDNDEQVRSVIDRIISPIGRRVDEKTPVVNARLPEGHRVHVIIPPLALDGPTLTIRKFRSNMFDLAELQSMGSCSENVAQLLAWAVKSRQNIAVTGGTGSGKTTLLNALSIEIPHHERIITIEDSAELKFNRHPHVVRLESRLSNIEGQGAVTIRDLVINSLRMRPDRIIVGEVRGAEALEMLQAMNTGHDGSLTTLHANSPREALSRLVTMVGYGVDMPITHVLNQIGAAIDLIVHQARLLDGSRRITDVVSVESGTDGKCVLHDLVCFSQQGVADNGTVVGSYTYNERPKFLKDVIARGIASESEVRAWESLVY